jgi:signal transduction histidine kinase/CheY-like chemotaxis protein
VAAAAVLFLLLAALRETTFGRGETTPRARWRLAPLLALWLAGGLAFANWCGRQSRSTYEAAILAQARVGAATINASEVEECLDPAFKLESIVRIPTPDGREEIAATASHLRRSPAADLRRHLGLLRSATKDALWAQLLTLREGHLVAYAFDTRIPVATGLVSLLRQTSPADEAAWAGRLDFVEGPIYQSDQVVRVSAPIVTADRRMLGWFSLVFSVARWTNVQAYARLQAFALVAAGAALGLFALFARWRNLERTQAIAEADAAREADKIKTVFLAKVSHELRTPVQSILGYCELSLRGVTDAATRRHMQAVLSQGHVLVRLINDLIDLSAIQAGAFRLERRAFDVLALAREVTGSQSPAALMKGLGLSFIPEGAVPALLVGDPDRVRQIFVNLVGNALKYTARGSVTVILRAGPLVADSCACALAVEDTGPGIAAEDQARLFRPFGRLEPTAHIEGTGLGLALTKALCEAMDGSISVASEPGRGSTFTARFMLGAAPSLPSGEPAAPPVAPALRVLLADDNALVRELFHAWLTDAGAAVTTAADGVEVCERVAEAVPDVLVIDIAMPRLNGVEATRRLRAAGHLPPRLRIVGVSAHATAADRETALQAGMDAFLIKPVERHDLLAALVPPGRKGALSQEAALLEKLARIFARETPAQLESLAAAVAAGDFAAVARLAHLLRNSADVLQDGAFAAACARLETRAAAAQPMAGALAAVVAAAGRHLPSLSPLSTPAGGQLNPN